MKNFITIVQKEVTGITRDQEGRIQAIEVDIDLMDCISEEVIFETVSLAVDERLNILYHDSLHNLVKEHFDMFKMFLQDNKLRILTGGVVNG